MHDRSSEHDIAEIIAVSKAGTAERILATRYGIALESLNGQYERKMSGGSRGRIAANSRRTVGKEHTITALVCQTTVIQCQQMSPKKR